MCHSFAINKSPIQLFLSKVLALWDNLIRFRTQLNSYSFVLGFVPGKPKKPANIQRNESSNVPKGNIISGIQPSTISSKKGLRIYQLHLEQTGEPMPDFTTFSIFHKNMVNSLLLIATLTLRDNNETSASKGCIHKEPSS